MENILGIVIHKNFIEEVNTVIKINSIKNVVVSPFITEYRNVSNEDNNNLVDAIKLCEKNCNKIIIIIDSNYKILFVNKSIEKLLNLTDFKSILGKNLFDLCIIHDDYREIVLNRFKKVIEDSIPVPLIEEKFIQSDGTVIPVNIYSDAIEYEGNLCILSVIRDISEHKQTESLKLKVQEQSKLLNEAVEYDKLKTEFFANLSHEFRTPLNVMLSTLQLLNLIGINKPAIENKDKIKKYYSI